MTIELAGAASAPAAECQSDALAALGVEIVGSGALAVPVRLPVRSLSASSLERFERCPEQWRAHYLDGVREPPSVAMATGRAFGAAIAAYFQARIDGLALSAADVDDRLVGELEAAYAEAEPREKEDPERSREGARAATRAYLERIAPGIEPVATERKVVFGFPDCEWQVVGYLDLETADGVVIDHKLGERHVAEGRAHTDAQATSYLLARALEGAPAAGFRFHSGVLRERRDAERWRLLPPDGPAGRTERQLEAFQARVAAVARRIALAEASGEWGYGPHGWWCGESRCPVWERCPAGGLR